MHKTGWERMNSSCHLTGHDIKEEVGDLGGPSLQSRLVVPLTETRWLKGVMSWKEDYELFWVMLFPVVMSTRDLKMWA